MRKEIAAVIPWNPNECRATEEASVGKKLDDQDHTTNRLETAKMFLCLRSSIAHCPDQRLLPGASMCYKRLCANGCASV